MFAQFVLSFLCTKSIIPPLLRLFYIFKFIHITGEEDEEWEEEEEEDGAGEEEGDWEWEYYSNEEGEGEEEEEEAKESEETKDERRPSLIPQLDPQSAWIVKGLKQMVPRIPNKTDTEKLQKNEDSDDEEPEEVKITFF